MHYPRELKYLLGCDPKEARTQFVGFWDRCPDLDCLTLHRTDSPPARTAFEIIETLTAANNEIRHVRAVVCITPHWQERGQTGFNLRINAATGHSDNLYFSPETERYQAFPESELERTPERFASYLGCWIVAVEDEDSKPGTGAQINIIVEQPAPSVVVQPSISPEVAESISQRVASHLMREGVTVATKEDVTDTDEQVKTTQDYIVTQILVNGQIMKQHYESYYPPTAMEIIAAIPKARQLCDHEGGPWGPGKIAKFCPSVATTVGRYLKAFRAVGLTHVKGIAIPREQKKRKKPQEKL